LYPLLKYSYKLSYEERPNYSKLKFLIKKILIEREYIPDNKFDWSLYPGEQFKKINVNDNHSSMSSCNLNTQEDVTSENIYAYDREKNLRKLKDKYNTEKTKLREPVMKTA
jgi:hypothetical protein